MITFFILVAHPQRTIKKKLLHYVITSLIHLNLMPLPFWVKDFCFHFKNKWSIIYFRNTKEPCPKGEYHEKN